MLLGMTTLPILHIKTETEKLKAESNISMNETKVSVPHTLLFPVDQIFSMSWAGCDDSNNVQSHQKM